MKRFVKTFISLMVVLLLLITGVNTALDHVAAAPEQASFIYYSAQGRPLYVYDGNLTVCKAFNHPMVSRVGVIPRA
jgi:hypothetical protein